MVASLFFIRWFWPPGGGGGGWTFRHRYIDTVLSSAENSGQSNLVSQWITVPKLSWWSDLLTCGFDDCLEYYDVICHLRSTKFHNTKSMNFYLNIHGRLRLFHTKTILTHWKGKTKKELKTMKTRTSEPLVKSIWKWNGAGWEMIQEIVAKLDFVRNLPKNSFIWLIIIDLFLCNKQNCSMNQLMR
jgi:hypothetical protein